MNFINECKNRANANRLGKIALEGREKLNNQTLLIENSVPNSKIDLELCGKSTQETRSGRNLLNVTAESFSMMGVTVTINSDKTIVLNGTYTGTETYWRRLAKDFTIPAGTYTLSNGNPDASTSTAIFKDDSNNFDIVDVSTKTFTEEKVIKPYLRIAVGSSFNNFKIYPMIVSGDTVGEYEPYGVSPSPDYPSEIENVKGNNLFKPLNYTSNGITTTYDKNGVGTIKGTSTSKWANISNNVIYSYPAGNYALSIDKPKTFNVSIKGTYTDKEVFEFSIFAGSKTKNVAFKKEVHSMYAYISGFEAETTLDDIIKIQLEKGSIATRYVPYGNIQIVETGKNIAKFDPSKNTNINSWIYTSNVANNITATKKGTGDSFYATFVANVVKDEQYVFSTSTSEHISMYCYSDKLWGTVIKGLSAVGLSSAVPLKFTSNYTGQMVIGLYGTTTSVEAKDFQLEKGPIATPYEPYTEEVVNIDLKGNELTKYDKLIIKDGRATIQKKSRHLSLAIKDMNNFEDYPGWQPQPELLKDYPNKNGSFDSVPISYMTNISNSGFRVNLNTVGSNGVIFLSKSVYGLTQTQWKEKYPDLVFDLIYELETPEEIDLGKITTLKTFNGTTYITNSEDAEMSVEASVWQNEISNSDYLQSFEMDSGCYVDGNIIGSVYSKCLKANFINDKNNLTDKTIQAQIGVKYADLSDEYINMGKYTVERPNNEITANMSQITAYDDLYTNLDKKYICNIDYSDGNKTLSDLYIDVCEQLELIPVTTTFTNSTILITDNPFTNGETNRTVLQTVAKISCSFVDIDNDTNEIDLCWLRQNEEPDYIFYKSDYSNVEGGKIVCGPINCLIIKNSQIDDENVTIKDEESIKLNGEHSITISEDYVLYNAELRKQAINAIWNKVKGMKYVDCKLTTYYGKPFLKLGNKIRVYISETEYFDTFVLKHNFTYDGTFASVIESPALTEQEIKTKQDVSLGEALRNTQIEVNKQKGEIRSITTKQENIQSDITNNYYNKTNINELLQTAESGITNTFSEAGGNNIFRNTGLWFKADTANIQNLYNESFIYCTYNSDAVNKSLTNVYPSSTSVTSYIRSEELMEINSEYEYSLDVPELTYKHGDTTLSYKTSLLELTSNREFQLENGEILKHELSAGSSTIKFKNNTAYVMLLLENQNFSRNILVGDDLNGKTIYSSLPDNFYETLNEQAVTTSMFVKTSTSNAIGVHTQLSKGLFNVGCNTISNFEQSIMPMIIFYVKNDITTVNEKSLTMSDTFGIVTEIDENNLAYPYLKIGIDTNLEIADAKTTLKELSIQIKTSDNLYEFWEGEIVRNSNDEAANNNSMLLLNGEVYQEQEVPNGNYAVSFMYQKLNELANASVLINDKEYQLDSTELKQFYTGEQDNETKEYITQPVEVTTNHIRITFKCNVDNAVEIYDLMCNKGTVKLAYSQNENETTTETVNISKGITITSTNMETIFKANANGIKILTLQNATIAYFTDKGLSTKELIVEDEAQICRTLIQDVGDQTWFTRM